jgi:hypothetical protein
MKTTEFRFAMILFIVASLVAIIPPSRVGAQDGPILFPEIETIENMPLEITSVPFLIDADVYFPKASAADDAFPIVVFLQGANVDKSDYSGFGTELARFGFVVVIPNRTPAPGPLDPFPDEFLILDVLELMIAKDNDQTSLLFGIVDTDRMGIAGHSAGGAAGLFAIGRSCQFPFCGPPNPPFPIPFPLPPAVKGGAFYGTNTIPAFPPGVTDPIPVNTNGIPVALVQGTRDGISTQAEAEATIAVITGPSELHLILDEERGTNHYGITDVNNPPGAIPDIPVLLPPPNIVQPESIELIAQATGEFLLEALTEGDLIPGEFPVSAKKKLEVDDEVTVNGRRVAKGKTEANSVVEIDANRATVGQFLPDLVPSVFPANSSEVKIKVTDHDPPFVSDTAMFFKEIEIEKEQSASFRGGGPFHIDKLKVKKGAVLNLGVGTYFVNTFDMKDDDARINLSSTPVALHIGDKFKVEAKRLILNKEGSVDGLRVYLHEDAEFKAKEMDFTGLLYGPESKKVEVEKATVTGAIIISGEVKIKKDTAISYTETDQALVGLTISIPE